MTPPGRSRRTSSVSGRPHRPRGFRRRGQRRDVVRRRRGPRRLDSENVAGGSGVSRNRFPRGCGLARRVGVLRAVDRRPVHQDRNRPPSAGSQDFGHPRRSCGPGIRPVAGGTNVASDRTRPSRSRGTTAGRRLPGISPPTMSQLDGELRDGPNGGHQEDGSRGGSPKSPYGPIARAEAPDERAEIQGPFERPAGGRLARGARHGEARTSAADEQGSGYSQTFGRPCGAINATNADASAPPADRTR